MAAAVDPKSATQTLKAGPMLGFVLASAGRHAQSRFRIALEPHGLHPRAFGVLLALNDTNGQSQQQLSRNLAIPASRVVALIDDLQAAGFVERRPHESDRRIYSVSLTARGAAHLDRAATTALQLEALITTGLTAQEQQQLRDLLRRATANLDGGHDDGLRVW